MRAQDAAFQITKLFHHHQIVALWGLVVDGGATTSDQVLEIGWRRGLSTW